MGIGRSTLAEPVVARFPTAVGQQPSPRMTLWEDVGSSVEHGGGHHWLWRASLRVNSWSRGPENPTFTHLPLSALRPRGPSSPGVVSRTGPGALSGPVSGADGHPGVRWRGRTRPPTYQGTPTTHPALRARKQTPRPRGDTAQPGQGVCAMALRIHAQHWKERLRVVSRYAAADAWRGVPRPPAADAPPAACAPGRRGLAGGSPVRIADRPGKERVGLL